MKAQIEVTKSGLARRLGISHTRVAQLVLRGLPTKASGKIDLAAALKWVDKNSPVKSKVLHAAARRGESPAAEASAPPDLESLDIFLRNLAGGKYPSQAEAERARTTALAGLRILEYQRKAGALIPLDEATAVFFECSRNIRDTLLNWPGTVAPLIAADLDLPAGRVAEVLEAHVRTLLAALGEPAFNAPPGTRT